MCFDRLSKAPFAGSLDGRMNDDRTTLQMIEKDVGLKACVVYGALPPEMRREQARLFNDPDSDYKVRQKEGQMPALLECDPSSS